MCDKSPAMSLFFIVAIICLFIRDFHSSAWYIGKYNINSVADVSFHNWGWDEYPPGSVSVGWSMPTKNPSFAPIFPFTMIDVFAGIIVWRHEFTATSLFCFLLGRGEQVLLGWLHHGMGLFRAVTTVRKWMPIMTGTTLFDRLGGITNAGTQTHSFVPLTDRPTSHWLRPNQGRVRTGLQHLKFLPVVIEAASQCVITVCHRRAWQWW